MSNAHRIRLLATPTRAGRPDGVQVMVAQRPRLCRAHVLRRHHGHRRGRSARAEAGGFVACPPNARQPSPGA